MNNATPIMYPLYTPGIKDTNINRAKPAVHPPIMEEIPALLAFGINEDVSLLKNPLPIRAFAERAKPAIQTMVF